MRRVTASILFCLILIISSVGVAEVARPESIKAQQQGDEIVASRTIDSKEFYMGDGSTYSWTSDVALHYPDSPSGWLDIDTTIVPSDRPNWDWEVAKGNWELLIRDDTTVALIRDGNWIGFRYLGFAYYDAVSKDYHILQNRQTVTPVVDNNTIRWEGIFYGTNLEYQYLNDEFKENLEITQAARDWLTANPPSSYGLNNQNSYLVGYLECDWSLAYPAEDEQGGAVDFNDYEIEGSKIYWRHPVLGHIVSALPLGYATHDELEPEDWVDVRYRFYSNQGTHYLFFGAKVIPLSQYPAGTIIIDPSLDERPTKSNPTLRLNRWDGECYMEVDTSTLNINRVRMVDGVIYGYGRRENFELYTLVPDEQMDGGAVEFNVILKRKPASNQIVFPINTQNLSFYYQPPLTAKYTNGWSEEFQDTIVANETHIVSSTNSSLVYAYRPENIVGSYAVYHSSKEGDYTALGGKNYMAGKAHHILRPYVIDSAGSGVWADLNIDTNAGTQTVIIPQTFLDNAIYPIYHSTGETFGYTSIGGSDWIFASDGLQGSLFTSPVDTDTGISISSYSKYDLAAMNMKGVLVLHNNLNIVSNGVGNGVALGSSYAWKTSTFGTPPSITPSTGYVICSIASPAVGTYSTKYDSGDANQYHYDESNNYASPTNPTDAGDDMNVKLSIYCTYTPAAGCTPAITNSPSTFDFGTLEVSESSATGLTYFTLTNTGSCAVDVTIHGHDMTGGSGWTLSDAGTAGDGIYAMKAGLDGGSYNIIVKKTAAFNVLKSNLGASATQDWGVTLWSPTASIGNSAMSGTITLTATEYTP